MQFLRPLLICSLLAADAFLLQPDNATGRVSGNLGRLDEFAYRWHMPANSSSIEGLGGGLQWVLDPNFCADMLPRFPEDSIAAYFLFASVRFVSCDSLKLAIERGFSTWSDNHPLISFVDITATRGCANRPPPDAPTAECPWEIYVSADTRTKDASRAAYVTTYQASYFGERYWETETRSTAGTTRIGVDATRRAVMRFQTRICWYLDATFCYMFHQGTENGRDVQLIVQSVLATLFIGAALRLAFIVYCFISAMAEPSTARVVPSPLPHPQPPEGAGGSAPGTPRSEPSMPRSPSRYSTGAPPPRSPSRTSACGARLVHGLDYLSTVSPSSTLLVLVLLVAPPAFHQCIFRPCWECYDFEAAVAHEAGHALGFGHPDAFADRNIELRCGGGTLNASCAEPFKCAVLEEYDETQQSVMNSLTRNSPATCLAPTDFDGLHALYPICDGLRPASAECLKPVQNSGWLRLAAVIGVPLLLAVLLIMVPLHFLRRRERRKMDTLQEEHSLMERKLSSLSSQLHRLSSAGMPQSNDSRLLVFTSHQNSRPTPAPTPPHSTVSAATLSKQRRSRKMSPMIGDSPSTVQSLSSDSSSTQSHASLKTDNTETTSPASTGARHQNSGSESLEGGNRLEAFRHGASELKLEDVGDAEHLNTPRN